MRTPLWLRLARRPSHERGDPPKPSDFDPTIPARIYVNQMRDLAARVARLEAKRTERRP